MPDGTTGFTIEDAQHAIEAAHGSLHYVWARDMAPRLIAPGTLIRGLLDEGAMSVVYAPSNVGKSFFCLDVTFHVAMGWEWRGRTIRKPGCGIYVAAEGGNGFINRVVALRLHYQVSTDADIPLAVVPCPVNLLDPNADRDKLIALMRDAAEASGRPVVLVVIDTLSRAMAGGHENAPEDMTGFIQNIDAIRSAFGAHCMIVHHAGKDIARGARGHNSLRAATDTEIEIARVEGGESKLAFAKVTKQRDMPGDETFYFTLKPVELGLDDEEGQIVTSAVVEPAEPHAAEPREPLRRMKDMPALRLGKLVDVIASHGERVNAPKHIPDMPVTTIEAWRQALADGGLLDGETPDARRMQFNRTREALLKTGAIGIWKNYVWPVWD